MCTVSDISKQVATKKFYRLIDNKAGCYSGQRKL